MAFIAKTLADGQLAITQTVLYTVPALTTCYVKRFSIFNTNAAEQTVEVWINPSGSAARRWRRYVLAQNESADMLDDSDALLLPPGAKIEARTTTASAVDYFVMGVEETA